MDKSQVLIKELHRENLCTYYILPLIKLSKYSFASEANFIDSFLALNRLSIYVQIKDIFVCKHRMGAHPQYLATLERYGNYYGWFRLPGEWAEDIVLFTEGRYSKFSEQAKIMIKQYSCLQYRCRTVEGIVVTDVRLLALEKDEKSRQAVREIWEDYYDLVIDPDMELLGIPTEKTFMETAGLRRI